MKDNVESFNYYSETMCDGDHLPACLRDYIADIQAFNQVGFTGRTLNLADCSIAMTWLTTNS